MATQNKQYESIPQPSADLESLKRSLEAVIHNLEVLTGQRGRNAKAIDERLTDLKSVAEGGQARFTEFVEVQTDANGAFASRLTSVEATSDGISASGQIKFIASASPITGYYAEYDLRLTAGDVETGFTLLAKQVGGVKTSSIMLRASQFMLFDPANGPTPVFAYMSGYFTFNVPVFFTDDVFFENSVRGSKLLDDTVSNNLFVRDPANITSGVILTITVPAKARIDIVADFDGKPSESFNAVDGVTEKLILERIASDDQVNILQQRELNRFFVDRENSPNEFYYLGTQILAQDSVSAGTWRYRVKTTITRGPLTIKAVVLYK